MNLQARYLKKQETKVQRKLLNDVKFFLRWPSQTDQQLETLPRAEKVLLSAQKPKLLTFQFV